MAPRHFKGSPSRPPAANPGDADNGASPAPTPFTQLGGEHKLWAIIRTFVGAVIDDIMIGFMFAKVHRRRLEELEYQHAAAFLGAPVVYRGRPLDKAHAPHRIAGGQFNRRRQILAETLVAHRVPAALQVAWLAHQDSLRHLITQDRQGACHGRQPGSNKA